MFVMSTCMLTSTDERIQNLLQLLSPLEPLKRHSDIRSIRLEGTGNWLLQNDSFSNWYSGNTSDIVHQTTGHVLFCHGMPGAGKTMLK